MLQPCWQRFNLTNGVNVTLERDCSRARVDVRTFLKEFCGLLIAINQRVSDIILGEYCH